MSHAGTVHAHPPGAEAFASMRGDNVRLAGPLPAGGLLLIAGLVLAGLTLAAGAMGLGGVTFKHALAAYHIGATATLAVCLGAMVLTMIFHLTNAGWTATIRRQFENVMSFTPWACLMVLVTVGVDLGLGGVLFPWMNPSWFDDVLLQNKAGYFFWPLNPVEGHFTIPVFFLVRAAIYLGLWTYLARRLRRLSVEQDASGDPALSLRARFTSSWGILLFALSTAFAAFDWLMSLDFRYFSTMWGVYYFAGAVYCAVAVVILAFATLRRRGMLEGVVTGEHFHDLGKLLFAFTVFWAYIAFFQYFLTWYANIPEETSYFLHRQTGAWKALGVTLMLGHFAVPFLILLFRPVKRNPGSLMVMAAWAVLIHIADIAWIVRPMAYLPTEGAGPGAGAAWLDVIGIAAVPLVFTGFYLRIIGAGPLVCLRDPRLAEAMSHKNYV